jgi:hypothetical protein
MRAVESLNDRNRHQLTDDRKAAKPEKVTEIDAARGRDSMHFSNRRA